MSLSRRIFLKTALAATPAIAFAGINRPAIAVPNGTRPGVLSNVSVSVASSSQARVSGRYTTLAGAPIAGMRVDIYAVTDTTFILRSTVYTDNAGNFTALIPRASSGINQIQIEVAGNGTFSRPYPTFSLP